MSEPYIIVCAYFHPTTTELDICYLYFSKNFKNSKHLQGSKMPVAKISRPIIAPIKGKAVVGSPKEQCKREYHCQKAVAVRSLSQFRASSISKNQTSKHKPRSSREHKWSLDKNTLIPKASLCQFWLKHCKLFISYNIRYQIASSKHYYGQNKINTIGIFEPPEQHKKVKCNPIHAHR